MNQERSTHKHIRTLTTLALLTAIVVVLQLLGSRLHIGPIPFSLVLVPIVIGAIVLGPGAGAFLGAVFGVIVLGAGITGSDQFTFFLWTASPVWTAAVCLVKGVLAGAVAGWIARAFGNHVTLGCIFAAVCAPIVNTGIFAVTMLTVLREELTAFAGQLQWAGSTLSLLFIGMIGVNFLVEFCINAVLSAGIARIAKHVLRD